MEPGAGWTKGDGGATEATPLRPRDLPAARLNVSTNVVLLFRLNELKDLCHVNFILACLTLLYLSVNVCMFWVNAQDRNDEDCGDPVSVFVRRCGSPVSEFAFHMVEFWATFAYAGVEAFALVYTPRALSSISNRPMTLKVLLFFDIVATFVPACLVSMDLERYEVLAHEIEYSNELTMAFVNLVLLASLLRRRAPPSDGPPPTEAASLADDNRTTACVAAGAAVIAILQILVYNCGFVDRGRRFYNENAERDAHFLEFTFAILSSFVTFWFCLDNRALGEEEILCILYGNHRDCDNCAVVHAAKKSELVMLADSRSLNQVARARTRSGDAAEGKPPNAHGHASGCGLV